MRVFVTAMPPEVVLFQLGAARHWEVAPTLPASRGALPPEGELFQLGAARH